jgi:regulator of cell morphogenesis and NO signaling
MQPDTLALPRHRSLAELATRRSGAALVFHRFGLDFCCHGQETLGAACARRGLDPAGLERELAEAERRVPAEVHWDERPLAELVEHVLERYHAAHRAELPRLIEMARKVERVHAEKPSAPRGLADFLEHLARSLEEHMQKEEQVLFPLIRAGRGRMAAMPVQVMEREHEDHGRNLARLRALTNDHRAPDEACTTWRALYLGLADLERELMQHIHLENNVLFPRALRS